MGGGTTSLSRMWVACCAKTRYRERSFPSCQNGSTVEDRLPERDRSGGDPQAVGGAARRSPASAGSAAIPPAIGTVSDPSPPPAASGWTATVPRLPCGRSPYGKEYVFRRPRRRCGRLRPGRLAHTDGQAERDRAPHCARGRPRCGRSRPPQLSLRRPAPSEPHRPVRPKSACGIRAAHPALARVLAQPMQEGRLLMVPVVLAVLPPTTTPRLSSSSTLLGS